MNDTCDLVHLLKTRKIYLTQTSRHRAVIVSAVTIAATLTLPQPLFMSFHTWWRLMDAIQLTRAITASSCFFPNEFNTFLDEYFSNICIMHIYPVAILLFHLRSLYYSRQQTRER